MNPNLVTALATKSGEAAIDTAKEEAKSFLEKVIGPSAEAIGQSFAIRFKERMFNNLVEVVARAKKRLKDSGIQPNEVPLKIIYPLLESAALEDEPDLQEMWANLLAGAAEKSTMSMPAFVEVLRQLSAQEARFLKLFLERLDEMIQESKSVSTETREAPVRQIGSHESVTTIMFEANNMGDSESQRVVARVLLDNICRLGIFRAPTFGSPFYLVTAFGLFFLDHCMNKDLTLADET